MAADRPEEMMSGAGGGAPGEGFARRRPAEGETRWERPPSRGFWTLLDDVERAEFHALAEEREWRAGEVIYREGDTSTDVSVLRRGWAKVVVSAGDTEMIVAFRFPGDVLGEWAALTGLPRSATVVALGDGIALTVSGHHFRDLLRRHPHADAVLRRHVAERLTGSAARLLAYESVDEARRMASLILELAQLRGIREESGQIRLTLPVTAEDLAQWVGASPATVSSELSEWRRNGIVRTGPRRITLTDVGKLERLVGASSSAGPDAGREGPGEPSRTWSASAAEGMSPYCSILVVDVVGFGDPVRHEAAQRFVRDNMYRMLRQAFDGGGVPWARTYHEDRGDGVLVIVPPTVPVVAVLDPVLNRLHAGLRRHNEVANEAGRIRMRVSVHAGLVHPDAEGISGSAVLEAFRLVDAKVLRDVFSTTAADVAWLVSDHLYQTVVRHGPELIDPRTYGEVRVEVKEVDTPAWLHVPGHPPGGVPGPLPTASRLGRGSGGRDRARIFVCGDITVGGDVVAGDKHVHGGG